MVNRYEIRHIHRNFKRNDRNAYTVYAELWNVIEDECIIIATLDYILEAIKVTQYTLVDDII